MKPIDKKFCRKVLRELSKTSLPIVTPELVSNSDAIAQNLSERIKSHDYLPSAILGYLGLEKKDGVTRFLPILSPQDMVAYYHLCRSVADGVLLTRPGIFGGWRSVPKSQTVKEIRTFLEEEGLAQLEVGHYFNARLGSSVWWKEYRSFTNLIDDLTDSKEFGNFVVQSDISNFYDSIEIPYLISRLRREAKLSNELIGSLESFLGLWNRRTTGYRSSTKGIPQEILSDASRVLSHYYLQEFDERLVKYSLHNGLRYVRWADDILFFGPSKRALTEAIHFSSKELLKIGLNLNAGKTEIFSRSGYRRYRAIDFLSMVESKNRNGVLRELRRLNRGNESLPYRRDTVVRAMIGFMGRNPSLIRSEERAYIQGAARDYPEIFRSLSGRQMYTFISVSDDPGRTFYLLQSLILAAPYAGPRANYLQMIGEYSSKLVSNGISKRRLESAVDKVSAQSGGSTLLVKYSVPWAKKRI